MIKIVTSFILIILFSSCFGVNKNTFIIDQECDDKFKLVGEVEVKYGYPHNIEIFFNVDTSHIFNIKLDNNNGYTKTISSSDFSMIDNKYKYSSDWYNKTCSVYFKCNEGSKLVNRILEIKISCL